MTNDRDSQVLDVGDVEIQIADRAMRRMMRELERIARSSLPVLVLGETGVGKEVAARAAHHFSGRRAGPFLPVNCAAVPEGLLSSTLFGHERGAFTGANRARPGLFEAARGGSIFFDEVGELDLALQASLLRALAEHRILPLGAATERSVDVRVIAATNRDLASEVAKGRFREDLYFRLCPATVVVPPLRKRPDDIPLLAAKFLAAARAELGETTARLSAAAMKALCNYGWPGNVRELKDAMHFAAASLDSDGVNVELEHLPAAAAGRARCPGSSATEPTRIGSPTKFEPLANETAALESMRIEQALEATGGNQSKAAELLSVPRRTFIAKMRRYGIAPRRRRDERARSNGAIH
jgi:transcriptional regulator with GAF, ATPase, and Fis domain